MQVNSGCHAQSVHEQKDSEHTMGEQIGKGAHGQISKLSFSTAEARTLKHFLGL